MVNQTQQQQSLMAAYLDAFEKANGNRKVTISYEKGWYYITQGSLPSAYRASQIREMIDTLVCRVERVNG